MKLSEIPDTPADQPAPAARTKLSQVGEAPKPEPSLWQELTAETGPRPRMSSIWEGLKQSVKDIGTGTKQLASRVPTGEGMTNYAAQRQEGMGIADRQAQQSEQAFQANPTVAAHPNYAAGGRIAGGMGLGAAMGALVPGAGAATALGRIGAGMAAAGIPAMFQPVESDDYWAAKGKQVGLSVLTGGAVGGALGAASPRGAAAQMAGAGVPLTPGMQMGPSARSFEQSLEAFPILRGMIQRGEAKSIEGFNKAAVNQALEPIGETAPRNMVAGHGLIEYAKDRLSAAYDKIKPNLSFAETEWKGLMSDPKLMQTVSELSPDHKARLATILDNRVTSRFKNGYLDGEAFKTAESELSDKASSWGRGTQDQELGDALHKVIAEMRGSLVAQNGQYGKELQNINSSYAMFTQLRRAALGKTEGGKFTPEDLLGAALNMDKSAGKGAFAYGDALMQTFAEAANKTLGKVTQPGTTIPSRSLRNLTELLAIGGGGGAVAGGPAGAGTGAAIAGAAPYAAKLGMSVGGALGRAPGPIQQGIAGGAGEIPQDRTRQRLKAAAKVGELQNERAKANRRGDLVEFESLGKKLAEAHRDYRDLGGAA